MNRASPANLRQSLEVANTYAKVGIDFVCIPVLSETDRVELTNQGALRIEQLLDRAEAEDAGQ